MKFRFFRALVLLVAPLFTTAALAQSNVSVNVTGSALTASGSASINLAAVGNENTVSFTLNWDPTVLAYVSDAVGSAVPTDGSATVTRNKTQTAAGKLGVLIGLEPGTSYAAGTRPLLVVNFTVLANAASTSLALVDTPTARRVVDPNGDRITTAVFTDLTIVANLPPAPPVFTTQPANQTAISGQNASITVAATGNPTPTFTWQKSTDAGVNWSPVTDGGSFSGATTSTLLITGARSTDVASYRAVATNTQATVNSNGATLTVNKANQTITFGPLAATSFGAGIISLSGTASSGLPVSYVSSDTNVATVSGSTVTIVGVGATTITASQSGNSEYSAAADVSQVLNVGKATATVTLVGLSATYDGTPKIVTATTNPASLNVDITYNGSVTPPANVGTYAVVGTVNSAHYAGTTSDNLIISKASQAITFGVLAAKTFNDPSFDLSASTTSPLTVTFASSNAAVATISGKTVTIVGAGTTTITASQIGDANFLAATNVPQLLTVNKATATVTLGSLTATYDGQPKSATAVTDPANLPVTFTYDGTAIAPTNAATYAVVGTINHPNYSGSGSGSLTIAKAPQTITFDTLPSKALDESPFALTATASSGLAVSYVSSDTNVATIGGPNGNIVTPVHTGQTTITASQDGNVNYLPAVPVPQGLTVLNASQTITFEGSELTGKTFGGAPFTLAATSNRGLTVTFISSNTAVATVTGNIVTIVGAGTTIITAKQPGNSDFAAAPDVPRTLVVAKAVAPVTLGSLTPTYDGTPKAVTATTVPPGLNVTFTYAGSATPPTDVGTYAVVATVNDVNYLGTASDNLIIAKAPQTITFGALATKTFNDPAFDLTATTTSPLTVAYTSSNAAVATVSGKTVTIVGAGSTVITATQVGDGNFLAAPSVPQTLIVNKAAATVTLGSLAAVYSGTPKPATAVTAPVGLNVTFTYDGNASAPTNAGTYAVVGTINDANYAGSSASNLVIAKAPQTITFAALPSKPLDEVSFVLAGTSSSGLALSYTSSDTNVATIGGPNGATVTLLHTGTTTITASQAGDMNYLPAVDAPQSLTVLNASQTITFAGTELTGKTFGDPTFALTATSNRGLTVSFVSSDTTVATVAGNIVTIVGAGTATITAQQAGNSDFAAAPDVARTLTVAKKVATGTLNDLAQTFDTTPKSVTATTVPVGLTVTFTYAGSATPPTNAGSYAVIGTIVDSNYTGTISGSLVIAKAAQTISFGTLPIKLVNAAPFTLAATSSSGLPVSYASSSPTVATISGNTVTPVAIGTTTITASQAGDANYNAATNVTQVLTVNPIAPVILSTPPLAATAVLNRSFLFGPITINSTPATFSASGLPAGLTVNTSLGTISGAPTAAPVPNPAIIVLTASNVTGSDSRTITLTVQDPPPVITSAASASGRVGTGFTFNVAATNSPTNYAATGLPSPLTISPTGGQITGTPTTAGTYTVQLTVTNAAGSVSQPFVLVIEPPLNAPVYTGTLNPSGTQGVAFSFTPAFGTVTAPYTLTGALPTGLSFTAATGIIAGTPTVTGSFPVVLAATNAGGTTSVNLTIVINAAPAAPVITSSSIAPSARVGTAFTFQLTSTGTPAASSYSATGLPAGLAIVAGTGVISGTPTTFGSFSVTVAATNTVGTGPTSILTISVAPSATAPVITRSPIINGQVGVAFSGVSLTASPAATSFAITSGTLPAGLNLDTASGAITGTPLAAALGQTRVWFAGTNASGAGLAMEILFTISPAAATPVVNSNGTATAQVGQPFQYVITATNGPLTAYAAANRPAWLALDTATGILSGIPTEATTTAISIGLSASNAGGAGNPKTLLLTVAPAPATPLITSALTASGRVGTAFSYQITASETPTSYVAAGLPPGLSINPTTGAISGSPTVSNTYSVVLRASNAGGLGAPSTLVIDVAPAAAAPAITSAAAASAQVGVAFTYQTVATNGPILSYALAGTGMLPIGLSLNTATGAITGTPSDDPRSYSVQLTATNAGGTSLPQTLTISLAPALGVPVVTTPLYVVGTVGVDFSLTVTATNLTGTAPYAPPILLEAIGLPSGLAINPATGVIAGRPVAVGTTVATLVATNASGTGPSRDLTIFVLPAPTAPVVGGAAVAVGQVNEPFTYQIVASNNPTSYEVLNSPVWITLNPTTGAVTGVPTTPGTFTVQLTASNAAGTSNPAILGLFISPAANTPVITSTRTASGTVGTLFTYTPVATPAATGYVASGLPGGLGLNPSTGVIGGTPNVSGTFNVILTPSNANGVGAPVTIVITIVPNVTFGG